MPNLLSVLEEKLLEEKEVGHGIDEHDAERWKDGYNQAIKHFRTALEKIDVGELVQLDEGKLVEYLSNQSCEQFMYAKDEGDTTPEWYINYDALVKAICKADVVKVKGK